MSCLTTTEKAKAIVGSLIHELNKIKQGKEKTESLWLSICMIIKCYDDKQLANIGAIAAIAEWYNLFNEDTKENQALLLHILSYYYDLMKNNGGFCLECSHCKPLREKGIHKKTLIKNWINQVRIEKCGCGNALIWEAYCSKTGLDEEYYRKPWMLEKIIEAHTLLEKGVRYELKPNKRKRASQDY